MTPARALDQIKPGDQLPRSRHSQRDGAEFTADEIVSAHFEYRRTISALDASAALSRSNLARRTHHRENHCGITVAQTACPDGAADRHAPERNSTEITADRAHSGWRRLRAHAEATAKPSGSQPGGSASAGSGGMGSPQWGHCRPATDDSRMPAATLEDLQRVKP